MGTQITHNQDQSAPNLSGIDQFESLKPHQFIEFWVNILGVLMANFLVAGLIDIETTMQVEEFPVEYSPVEYPFFTIDATVSGVGYNITKALTRLGNRATLLSILGQDLAVASVRAEFAAHYIDDSYVVETAAQTARSVIMYDKNGKRKIIVDLKDYQEQTYPHGKFERALPQCGMAVLCNINFTRPMLSLAKQAGKSIATDVHTIEELEDDYNRDYMEAADILFMSDELLPCPPEEWAQEVMGRYSPEVLVIGMGKKGALMAVKKDEYLGTFPALNVRPVVNTIGAGDALFSAFLHSYAENGDPYEAIKKASLFAAYKVGARSASEGFLSKGRLEKLYQESLAATNH
jgi:ribokinase